MTSQQTSILHVFRQSVAQWRDLQVGFGPALIVKGTGISPRPSF
jgi:hypothetical protein